MHSCLLMGMLLAGWTNAYTNIKDDYEVSERYLGYGVYGECQINGSGGARIGGRVSHDSDPTIHKDGRERAEVILLIPFN